MKLILSFALPLLGGMLFQQFYSLVDTLIVGRFLGLDALAGVGSTGSINFMIIGFVMGVANGFAIPISQRFGAKDYDGVKRFYFHGAVLTAILAAVMTVLVCVFSKAILIAMNTPENIFDYAYSYIFTICAGIVCIVMYNGDIPLQLYFISHQGSGGFKGSGSISRHSLGDQYSA